MNEPADYLDYESCSLLRLCEFLGPSIAHLERDQNVGIQSYVSTRLEQLGILCTGARIGFFDRKWVARLLFQRGVKSFVLSSSKFLVSLCDKELLDETEARFRSHLNVRELISGIPEVKSIRRFASSGSSHVWELLEFEMLLRFNRELLDPSIVAYYQWAHSVARHVSPLFGPEGQLDEFFVTYPSLGLSEEALSGLASLVRWQRQLDESAANSRAKMESRTEALWRALNPLAGESKVSQRHRSDAGIWAWFYEGLSTSPTLVSDLSFSTFVSLRDESDLAFAGAGKFLVAYWNSSDWSPSSFPVERVAGVDGLNV